VACTQVAIHEARIVTKKHYRKVIMGDEELVLLNCAHQYELAYP
jgi:hypothetical protein